MTCDNYVLGAIVGGWVVPVSANAADKTLARGLTP